MGPVGKKLYPFVILIAVAIGIFWGIHSRRNPSPVAQAANPFVTNRESTAFSRNVPGNTNVAGQPSLATNGETSIAPPGPDSTSGPERKHPEKPYQIGSAEAPPQMDSATLFGSVRHVINDYGSMFGGNPVGNNADITAALNGDNPKGVKFLREDFGMRVNGNGELVDSWGTPFFFHQLSGTEMEIRSAGPDRKMYTADDLVLK